MDDLPKTVSGKIDRKSLPVPKTSRPELNTLYREPETELQRIIAALWASLLLVDELGVGDNFFELGGNSLRAQTTITDLKLKHQVTVGITKLYQFPTPANLAEAIDNDQGSLLTSRESRKQNKANDTRSVAIIGMSGRF